MSAVKQRSCDGGMAEVKCGAEVINTLLFLVESYVDEVLPGLGDSAASRRYQKKMAELFLELLSSSGERALCGDHFPAHLTVSACLCNMDMSHVILCHHKKIGKWIPLGGHTEPHQDTSFGEACLRECEEESGISRETMQLHHPLRLHLSPENKQHFCHPPPFDLDIHLIPATPQGPAHQHYDVRFLITTPHLSPLHLTAEAHDVRWLPLAHVDRYTDEESTLRLVRKIIGLRPPGFIDRTLM